MYIFMPSPRRRRSGWVFFMLALAGCATGCADLKGINAFSTNSSRVVATPFPYGYSDYCYDSCYTYAGSSCDTVMPRRYDTAVAREAGKLAAYFNSLAKLSGSAEIIDVGTLAGDVQAGTYGKLTVTSTEASVFSGVTTGIQDLLTASFKSRHLAENLHRYGDTIGLAIGSYLIHLDALEGESDNLFQTLRTRLIVYRATASPADPAQWSVLYAYNTKMKELSEIHHRFELLRQQLLLLKSGYGDLVANADQIKSKALKQRLLILVNNITFLSNGTKN